LRFRSVNAKIGLLAVGQVDSAVMLNLQETLVKIFPDTTFTVVDAKFPLPEKAFDKTRHQYRSEVILNKIRDYASKRKSLRSVLGVVDADIFVPELNYVFGEAAYPGKAALISLWRLKPEFYGESADAALFAARALKEAVHELGHTLGLKHCPHSSCVMHFSNCIFDTDKKQSLFCDDCYLQATISINNLR